MILARTTIQDVVNMVKGSGGKKWDLDAVLPFIIVPVLLFIGTISLTVTIGVMVIIAMGTLYVLSRPKQKNRSPFFYSWTLSSVAYMYLIFEIKVLKEFRITKLEYFILLVMFLGTCCLFYKMKSVADYELASGSSKGKEYSPVLTSDSYYCKICQIEVNERFFHSIWWDCCIFRPNYCYFLAGQLFSFATLLYGTNLGLTTSCRPEVFFGDILMPVDCQDVYQDTTLALCFVACVYGLGYLLVISLVLIKHIFVYIPKYIAPHWRKLLHRLHITRRKNSSYTLLPHNVQIE